MALGLTLLCGTKTNDRWWCHSSVLPERGLHAHKMDIMYLGCHLTNAVFHTWQMPNNFCAELNCTHCPENVLFGAHVPVGEGIHFLRVSICRGVCPWPQNRAESIRSHREQHVVTGLCCTQLLHEEGPREGTCCLLRLVVLLWNAVLVWNVSTVVFFASVAMPLKFLLKSGVANSVLSWSALSSLGSFCFLCSCTFTSSFSLLGCLLPDTLNSYSFFSSLPLVTSLFPLWRWVKKKRENRQTQNQWFFQLDKRLDRGSLWSQVLGVW